VPQLKSKVEKMKEKVRLVEIISKLQANQLWIDANETKIGNTLVKLASFVKRRKNGQIHFFSAAQDCIPVRSWSSHEIEFFGQKELSK
jgi:hypothetical protein